MVLYSGRSGGCPSVKEVFEWIVHESFNDVFYAMYPHRKRLVLDGATGKKLSRISTSSREIEIVCKLI